MGGVLHQLPVVTSTLCKLAWYVMGCLLSPFLYLYSCHENIPTLSHSRVFDITSDICHSCLTAVLVS